MSLPAIIRPNTCRTCKFFHQAAANMPGECRRQPPQTTMVVLDIKNGVPDFHRSISFSLTLPDLWCGEHKPKL